MMRISSLIFGLILAEIALLAGSYHLFMKLDQDHLGGVLVAYFLVQLALICFGWIALVREKNRGKSAVALARQKVRSKRREERLGTYVAGLFIALHVGFGIVHFARGERSMITIVELLAWMVLTIGAFFIFERRRKNKPSLM